MWHRQTAVRLLGSCSRQHDLPHCRDCLLHSTSGDWKSRQTSISRCLKETMFTLCYW